MTRVRVLWTPAVEHGTAEDLVRRLAATWIGGPAGEVRTGRICPVCGSDRHGRPYLPAEGPADPPAISVSRTGSATVVAMSWAGPVGVDVEQLDGFQDPAVGDVLLHPSEVATGPGQLCTTWVRKEALLKASGQGLAVDPRTVLLGPPDAAATVLDRPGAEAAWVLDLDLAPDLRAAVAGLGARPDDVSVAREGPEGPPGRATPRTGPPGRDRW